ncbi:hypothetical protein [Ilyomonas limi]|nr:hypothetical protein [Ilyomonas limi]
MSLEEKKLLTDIFVAAPSIEEYLEGKRDYEAYMASKMLHCPVSNCLY